MQPPDIGIVIATHNRVDDARGGMEILRSAWEDSGMFAELPIVHAYNGDAAWWPRPYLEDKLLVLKNERTHYRGAAALLDAGVAALPRFYPQVRYAVVIASDVWLYSPAWVAQVLDEMRAFGKRLATARWRIEPFVDRLLPSAALPGLLPTDGLACDFFIVDVDWALKWGMFPLGYGDFLSAYAPLLNYAQEMPFLERYLAGKFLGAVRFELEETTRDKDPWGSTGPRRANQFLRQMSEREIDPTGSAAPSHKGHWPAIGVSTVEDVVGKRQIAIEHPQFIGPTLDRLRRDNDTSWFNTSAKRQHGTDVR